MDRNPIEKLCARGTRPRSLAVGQMSQSVACVEQLVQRRPNYYFTSCITVLLRSFNYVSWLAGPLQLRRGRGEGQARSRGGVQPAERHHHCRQESEQEQRRRQEARRRRAREQREEEAEASGPRRCRRLDQQQALLCIYIDVGSSSCNSPCSLDLAGTPCQCSCVAGG